MGPKYAVKYHTAAENALSHCYRSCLELLIENGLQRLFDRPMQCPLYLLEYVFVYLFGIIVIDLELSNIICQCSIAMGCIYTEAKNYPREPAAHVAISEKLSHLRLQFSILDD